MKKINYTFYVVIITFVFFQSCQSRNDKPPKKNQETSKEVNISKNYTKISHITFYIENSGSMFGYVNGTTEFVNAVNDLAQFSNLVKDEVPFSYNLISGKMDSQVTRDKLTIYPIGDNPSILGSQLTLKGLKKPSSGYSDLKNMFEIALTKARNDSISILISDCIYDVGGSSEPLTALDTEGKETRTKFIKRLQNDNIESLVIKLESDFKGLYHPANVSDPKGKSNSINQKRPYYIWIFGNSELLKNYFPEERIKDLMGYVDLARFNKLSNMEIPYTGIGFNNSGFRLDFKTANTFKLYHNVMDASCFNLAIDYSNLNLSDSYKTAINNYSCSGNYKVKEVKRIQQNPSNDLKPYLETLSFKPTHIVTIEATTAQPEVGEIFITLNNVLPNWIHQTNTNNDYPFDGNTYQTFGFGTLIEGIDEAYQEVSNVKYITKFQLNINN